MYISTPTQAPGSSPEKISPRDENSASGLQGDSSVSRGRRRGDAAQKSGGFGIFAKLLESLTAKGKISGEKAGGEEVSAETDGLKPGERKTQSPGLHNFVKIEGESGLDGPDNDGAGLSGRKARDSEKGSDSFIDESAAGTLASLRREFRAGQDLPRSGGTESGGARSAREGGGLSAGKTQKEANPEKGVTNLAEGNAEESGDSFAGISGELPDSGTLDAIELADAEKAGKPGRRAAETQAAGAENSSESFAQVFEMSRPESGSANFSGGGGADNKLSELRGRKGREKLNIGVRDLRTPEGREAEAGAGSGPNSADAGAFSPAASEIEVLLDPGQAAGRDGAGKGGRESLNQRFEDALARELRGNLSTDIVREAAVIVRNHGEGSIRLSLRPETLGNVKIRLELTENKITGHIIVESDEALRAFERELPVLEKAFRDSGFGETSLDMSFARDGRDFGGGQPEENFPVLAPVQVSSLYEAGIERVEDFSLTDGFFAPAADGRTPVNLLV